MKMKQLVQLKHEAIELRKQGFSYKEILAKVPVAKGTLSAWLGKLSLTDAQFENLKEQLKAKQNAGRLRTISTNRRRRLEREEIIQHIGQEEFDENMRDPFFLVGIALYWAEGGKRSNCFQFVNSDPVMVRVMITWVEKYLKISRQNLRFSVAIHEPYKHENCEEYWANQIGVPRQDFLKTVYKATLYNFKKNPYYKGCFRIGFS
ncbi:MAG: hypothetical protein NTY66_04720 [Candidatus Vogelbacteria bacterium]|nr:hypothetical protein [Candidatus Vogelbacteria bacterium]